MIEYELTKNEFKKYLKTKRFITNISFIIICSILYFYITFYLIFTNPFETFIYYLLYLILLIILILLFNELYCLINIKRNKNIIGKYKVNIKEDKVIIKINNKNYEYFNNNIKKIKRNKRYIIIKYQSNISLFFIKKLLNEKDYQIINNIKKISS